jgi:membrane fusion protein (multidrug efflux system)
MRYLVLCLLAGLMLTACEQSAQVSPPTPKRSQRAHLVDASEVVRKPTSSAYQRTASLRARRIARIYNQVSGRIERLPGFEGDTVEQGQLLLELDDALLRAERDKTQANARQAKLNLQRIQNLHKRQAASKDELERAKTALDVANAELRILQTRLGYTQVRAPFAGVISARLAEPGDVIAEHSHVLSLLDPSSLVVQIQVSELLLPHVRIGDPVAIRIDALGAERFSGKILRIHPALDPDTRQGVVEARLDPVPAGARAGQFARVTLHTAAAPRLLIPFPALQHDREGEFVYRVDAESKAQRTAVRSGLRIGREVEILEGLEAGQQVITRGLLGLSSGKKVQVVENKTGAG